MIQGFRRSRIASTALMTFSIFIAVIIWLRDRDYPFFIPLIASVLMIGIGFFPPGYWAMYWPVWKTPVIWGICTWSWTRTNF